MGNMLAQGQSKCESQIGKIEILTWCEQSRKPTNKWDTSGNAIKCYPHSVEIE